MNICSSAGHIDVFSEIKVRIKPGPKVLCYINRTDTSTTDHKCSILILRSRCFVPIIMNSVFRSLILSLSNIIQVLMSFTQHSIASIDSIHCLAGMRGKVGHHPHMREHQGGGF